MTMSSVLDCRAQITALAGLLGGPVGQGRNALTVDTYTRIAEEISKTARKKPPYNWRYPRQVEIGSQMPSPDFVDHVAKTWSRLSKPKPTRPRARRVTVTFPDAPAELVDAIQSLPPDVKRAALTNLVTKETANDNII
jgi:hypothetical protein